MVRNSLLLELNQFFPSHAALWQFQSLHGGLPNDFDNADQLESIANQYISEADVNKQILTKAPRELIECVFGQVPMECQYIDDFPFLRTSSITAAHEFSPVCAIVGGMLAQDVLKALGGREPPIANFFVFDGSTGGGTVCRMNMP